MYDLVMGIIPFKNVIYSIYMINDDVNTIISFMNKHHIRVMATDPARLTSDYMKKLKENNIIVYAFTVNSEIELSSLKSTGVYGFYTDALPSDKGNDWKGKELFAGTTEKRGEKKCGLFPLLTKLYEQISPDCRQDCKF